MRDKKEYLKEYYIKNKDRIKAQAKAYYERTKADRRDIKLAGGAAYRDRNRELLREKSKDYAANNKDKVRAKQTAYRLTNPDKCRYWCRNRQAKKSLRTPEWLSPDQLWVIAEAYELAALRTTISGSAWHVDHIVPLNGRMVSGLHVPWNLQVILGSENVRKSNSFAEENYAYT